MKPHVDTVGVEAMLARGKQPALLIVLKFTKADSTFKEELLLTGRDFVREDGERFNDGFVEADSAIRHVGLLAGEVQAATTPPRGGM